MKTLLVEARQLKSKGRWDIDFHLPPIGITKFPKELLSPISKGAHIVKAKRDPTKKPEMTFQYIDIASVDVETGIIRRPEELTGEEAPSRARKVVHAYDIIISTCRPTRGAIAVVTEELHGQICSTGFSVIRAKPGMNPFYLHFALRLESTLEQFRKWSTGSSYPAILDEDVGKTVIPMPPTAMQDELAKAILTATAEREAAIRDANQIWQGQMDGVLNSLRGNPWQYARTTDIGLVYSTEQIFERLKKLPPVEEDLATSNQEATELALFESTGE